MFLYIFSYTFLSIFYFILPTQASEFNNLENFYDTGDFESIYSQFSIDAKEDYPLKLFLDKHREIYQKHNKILCYINYTNDQSQNIFIIGFSESLAVGIMNWKYNSYQELTHFHINPYGQQSIVQYISQNLDKTWITLIHNQEIMFNHQASEYTPIHNFNFIAILIEFSRQVSTKELDPYQSVTIDELNKYYLKGYDIKHEQFLQEINNQNFTIYDIALGLVKYGSLCNAEYLQEILDITQIEKTLIELKINQTKQTYHVASKIVFSNFQNFSQEDYMNRIENLSFDNFLQAQNFIHTTIKLNTAISQYWLQFAYKDLMNGKVQQIMNNYFTQSNAMHYSLLLKICLNKESQYLNNEAYQIFEILMNNSFSNPRINYELQRKEFLFDLNSIKDNQNSYFSALFSGVDKSGNQRQFGIVIKGIDFEDEFQKYQSSFMLFCQLLSQDVYYFLEVIVRLRQSIFNFIE